MSASNSPAELLRERRLAHGLSQAQLARRAGTTQAQISRIEGGETSPTFGTLSSLLAALGEVVELGAIPAESDHDHAHLSDQIARSPEERLALAMSWNLLAGEVAHAGAAARGKADERA